ncbi:hypothetical protein I4U23_003828 [Adineta vaga]|nr:hypothetical protein I4U23_003828 [Adineta vaga]
MSKCLPNNVAYAINYVSQYTGNRNFSVIGWSQGTLNIQWALNYFRSTRKLVSDYIEISPDYRSIVLAQVLCLEFPRLPCAPSVHQQFDNSIFIKKSYDKMDPMLQDFFLMQVTI